MRLNKQLVSKATYLINICANDYTSASMTNSTVLQYYSRNRVCWNGHWQPNNCAQGIYKNGGRNFELVSLSPLGCFPSKRALNYELTGCMEKIAILTKLHNKVLSLAN